MPNTVLPKDGPVGKPSPLHGNHGPGSSATPKSDSVSPTIVHLQAQVSLESGETADEITSSGPLDKSLTATATSLQERYRQSWSCTFLNETYEAAYQRQMWRSRQVSRATGMFALVTAAAVHLGQLVASAADTPSPLRLVLPSVSLVAIGTGILAAATCRNPPQLVSKYWNVIGSIALFALVFPMVSLYSSFLCASLKDHGKVPLQCAAMDAKLFPWAEALLLVLSAFIGPSALHLGWVAGGATSLVLSITSAASICTFAEGDDAVLGGAAVCGAVVVVLIMLRRLEILERTGWARLHAADMALRQQAVAERRGSKALHRRDAAVSQAAEVQRVMRYVCHELRNPLHGLMGVLEGVHADVAECTRCRATLEDLETIRDTGSNMAVILNDVLDLGQLQRGKMNLVPVPTDFRLLIGQVVSTLLGLATVPIICKVAHTIPSAILVDPLRFSQIVTNGLSNAAKLTKRGQVELVAQVINGHLWVEVFDTGKGLPAGSGNLFQPYGQNGGTARATRSRFERGTGLGLAISAQLVRLMGGSIGLEDRCDGVTGARFWFHVPAKPALLTDGSSNSLMGGGTPTSAASSGSASQQPPGTSAASTPSAQLDVVVQPPELGVASVSQDAFQVTTLPPRRGRMSPFGSAYSSSTMQSRASHSTFGTASTSQLSSASFHTTGSTPHSFRDGQLPTLGEETARTQTALHARALHAAQSAASGTPTVASPGPTPVFVVSSPAAALRPQTGAVVVAATPSVRERLHQVDQLSVRDAPSIGVRAIREQPADGAALGSTPAAFMPGVAAAGDVLVPGTVRSSPVANASAMASPKLSVFRGNVRAAEAAVADMLQQSNRHTNQVVHSEPGLPITAGALSVSTTPEGEAGDLFSDGGHTNCKGSGSKSRRRRRRAKKPSLDATAFQGVHVLVVDDEKLNRTVLRRHCTRSGCTVRTLEDGDQLMELVNGGSVTPNARHIVDCDSEGQPLVSVIFLDIMMQRSNGEDIVKALRASGIRTPIVAATGNGVKEDLERYEAAGFTSVLLKPFSSQTVADLLRSVLAEANSLPSSDGGSAVTPTAAAAPAPQD